MKTNKTYSNEFINKVCDLLGYENLNATREQKETFVENMTFLMFEDFDPVKLALDILTGELTREEKEVFMYLLFYTQLVRNYGYSGLYHEVNKIVSNDPFFGEREEHVAEEIIDIVFDSAEKADEVYNSINNKKQAV